MKAEGGHVNPWPRRAMPNAAHGSGRPRQWRDPTATAAPMHAGNHARLSGLGGYVSVFPKLSYIWTFADGFIPVGLKNLPAATTPSRRAHRPGCERAAGRGRRRGAPGGSQAGVRFTSLR